LVFYVIAWLLLVAGAYFLTTRLAARRRVEERLREDQAVRPEPIVQDDQRSWLGRRLALAGLKGPHSTELFLVILVLAITAGIVLRVMIARSDPFYGARQWLLEVPGGAGLIIEPALAVIPWLVGVMVAVFPILWVRSRRRERIRAVEEDLPITLELLAAQARAGLGFEAALNQVLRGGDRKRPLAQELIIFQNELMAGIPRGRALRRFGRRLDVPSVSVFVSALVHAEQVGGGLSTTLRTQADDLRMRRRSRAFAIAQALPAKVVVPLVVCFLPGIFVWTLGPAIHQFVELIEQVLRTTGQG
jgi:tight adherence protein C